MLQFYNEIDLDEVFSYKTDKVVKILDRNLGIIYYIICCVIAAYILGIVFVRYEGYMETEQAWGHVGTTVSGQTYSFETDGKVRVWDPVDVVQPTMENGALFVATNVITTKQQVIDNCSNPELKCATDKDCPLDPPFSMAKCEKGNCLELQWCPHPHPGSDSVQVSQLKAANSFAVWFKATIQFPHLDSKSFTTVMEEKPIDYPAEGANQFLLNDLLTLAGTSYNAIRNAGCLLLVKLMWVCYLDDPSGLCSPQIQVSQLDGQQPDTPAGFTWKRAEYYRESDEEKRDHLQMSGVRMILVSQGVGKKISIMHVVLHISSGLALLKAASMLADFIMLYCMRESRHYRSFKEQRTPDFSDLRDRIAQLEGEEKKMRIKKKAFQDSHMVPSHHSTK